MKSDVVQTSGPKKKTKYYRLKNILQKNATYNVMFGERSNGKTYAVQEYCIKDYLSGKGQTAWIRRWQDDFKGKTRWPPCTQMAAGVGKRMDIRAFYSLKIIKKIIFYCLTGL